MCRGRRRRSGRRPVRYGLPIAGRFEAQVIADVFNALDTVNYDGFGGNVAGQGNFLTPQTAFNPREFQLGVRLQF